ncbi:MAG: dipeptidase [Bacteroidetes bacterium HGW-Bacteroidetes-1]|jgi:dipeptidase|nr:MAG: dipeptidase [Bacteroidetes bacterium HGW-Bacteroidetes-1]
MKKTLFALLTLGFIALTPMRSNACTNYLVTKGASVDGSTMITYAADSHVLYGELYHWSAGEHAAGTMIDIYEWDTGKFLGKIKQAPRSYNVVGNMNEFQVAIGETTYGGRPELVDTTGIVDYGSLIYLTLQRATSAREAIKIMAELVEENGYYSSGESFSISDKDEVWIMEMIGKGTTMKTDKKTKKTFNANKGAVWVALRIPDGYVSGHANQARIMTFPIADGKNSITSKNFDKIFEPDVEVVYADDVISFARSKGWFVGDDSEFSFSDTYAPVDFGGARFCDIRVWTMFNKVTDGMDKYWDYVKGNIKHEEIFEDGRPNPNKFATNRMPLWVKPEKKISVHDMMMFMRDYLQGTELDMSQDFGAGPHQSPYRWRPLTWKVDGITYVNERATATQQTGFSFITQSRSWLPNAIGGIIWWGVDDANTSVYMPMYSSITKVPYNFERGNGAMMEWSETSGFWITNMISNLSYTRYNMIHPDVAAVRDGLEKMFIERTSAIDLAALNIYKNDNAAAIAFLTDYSSEQGARTFQTYKTLYQEMFMKYMDGNVKTRNPGQQNPNVKFPGYSEQFLRKVAEDTGDKLKQIGGDSH